MVGWLAVILAILGFAGAIARAADLASHFRVAYALAMLPDLATYLPGVARRRWQPTLLILVLALDCTPIAVLYLPRARIPDEGPTGPSIRVIQFNTWLKASSERAAWLIPREDLACSRPGGCAMAP
jgi:endonuclease/exonuclease/phosphatase (EEP) superfamily protein YafD